MLKQTMPDAVILDLRMEERLTGLALLDRITGDPATRHIAVIICSGDRSALNTYAAHLDTRHCTVLVKPFDIGELLATVRAAVPPVASQTVATAGEGCGA